MWGHGTCDCGDYWLGRGLRDRHPMIVTVIGIYGWKEGEWQEPHWRE